MKKENTALPTYPISPLTEENFANGGPLSFSKVGKYIRCPKKYELHYLEGLRPREREERFMLGSAVHAFLEGCARRKVLLDLAEKRSMWEEFCSGIEYVNDYIDKHFDSLGGVENVTGEYWDEVIALRAEACMIGARAWNFFKPHEWKIAIIDGTPAIEIELKLALPVFFEGFIGYADLIAEDKDGHLWLIDYKTRVSAFTDYQLEEASTQFALYQYVLNCMGYPVEGTITFQCLDKLPEAPKVLKNGKISRAKNQNCDWETYKDFVIRAGLNVEDYLDMRQTLAGKEYFRLTKNYRQMNEVREVWGEFMKTAQRIYTEHVAKANETLNNAFPMHLKGGRMGCIQCSFYDYCMESLRGGDTDFIIETRFTRKGKEQPKKPETEIEIQWD